MLGEYDNATNYRFTAKDAGVYQFDGRVTFSDSAAGNDLRLYIYVNGAASGAGTIHLTGGAADTITISSSVKLTATQYIELYVYNGTLQNRSSLNDGNLCNLTITKVS